jgi:hypothetical protein
VGLAAGPVSPPTGCLLNRIGAARLTGLADAALPAACDVCIRAEEVALLQPGERLLAFQPGQLGGTLLPRGVPAARHLDLVLRDLLVAHQLEPRLADQPLVDAGWAEFEIARPAARGQLLVGHQAGHHHRVHVEHPAARAQHAVPLAEQAAPAG